MGKKSLRCKFPQIEAYEAQLKDCNSQETPVPKKETRLTLSIPEGDRLFFTPGKYNTGNIDFVVNSLKNILQPFLDRGAMIYGDYLKKILLPHSRNETLKHLDFKEVNLWWPNMTSLSSDPLSFCSRCYPFTDKCTEVCPLTQAVKITEKPRDKISYQILVGGCQIANLKVLVSSELPTELSDTDRLMCTDLHKEVVLVSKHPTKTVAQLCMEIDA